MKTMCIKFARPLNGKTRRLYVASTKKALMAKMKWLDDQGHAVVAWRYHDGSGWVDGSVDAWKEFNQIVGLEAEICI